MNSSDDLYSSTKSKSSHFTSLVSSNHHRFQIEQDHSPSWARGFEIGLLVALQQPGWHENIMKKLMIEWELTGGVPDTKWHLRIPVEDYTPEVEFSSKVLQLEV